MMITFIFPIGIKSEKQLIGNYWETNDPYKFIYFFQEYVYSLNDQQNVADTIGIDMLSVLTSQIFIGTVLSKPSKIGLTSL